MIIAVDFDGTVVEHDYPRVGLTLTKAVDVLKKLVTKDHKIILFTMRSGSSLQDAVSWYKSHGIPLFGVNENPYQHEWTDSPKVYAHLYIDDAALGCPLIETEDRPYVDWKKVEKILIKQGVL